MAAKVHSCCKGVQTAVMACLYLFAQHAMMLLHFRSPACHSTNSNTLPSFEIRHADMEPGITCRMLSQVLKFGLDPKHAAKVGPP